MKINLSALTLFLAISSAPAIGASSSTQLDEKSLVRSFLPVMLIRHDLGDGAGALYCPANACAAIPRSEADRELPEFLTSHTVRLGDRAPTITLECNGAGPLYCEVVEPGTSPENKKSHAIAIEYLFAPGDGCLYTANSDHADHVVRRKLCWEKGHLRERPQPVSYVGFKTTTNIRLALYPSPKIGLPVHWIRAGGFVEILAAIPEERESDSSKWILVRDSFGITGWVPVASLGEYNFCLMGRPLGIKGFCTTGD